MPIRVGRIDGALPPCRLSTGAAPEGAPSPEAFEACTRAATPPAASPPPVAPQPRPPRWVGTPPGHKGEDRLPSPRLRAGPQSVRDLLLALVAVDQGELRRVVAALGGTLDAGQLAYMLGATQADAAELVAALDEVGDGRLGIEEMERGNAAAVLADLS